MSPFSGYVDNCLYNSSDFQLQEIYVITHLLFVVLYTTAEINPREYYSLQVGSSLLRVVKNSCLEKLDTFLN